MSVRRQVNFRMTPHRAGIHNTTRRVIVLLGIATALVAAAAYLVQVAPSAPQVATPIPTATDESIGSLRVVADDQLGIVHVAPEPAAQVIATLQAGTRVPTLDTLKDTSGAYWASVQLDDSDRPSFGWIQVRPDGWPLAPAPATECPLKPNVLELVTMDPAERLSCFGSRELTLDHAILEMPSEDRAFSGNPIMFVTRSKLRMWGELGIGSPGGSLGVGVAAGAGAVPTGVWIRAIGHFDDPAAGRCSVTLRGVQLPASQARLWCREQFMIIGFVSVSPPAPSREPTDPIR